MSTNVSNSGPYLTPAQFLSRADQRTIARLCSDTNVPVPFANLATDPNLSAALQDASGIVESACLVGGRYQASDLAGLPSGSPAQGMLLRIISQVAVIYLYRRRPDLGSEEKAPLYEETMKTLEALSGGTALFAIAEVQNAGLVTTQRDRRGIVENLYRFFGSRHRHGNEGIGEPW